MKTYVLLWLPVLSLMFCITPNLYAGGSQLNRSASYDSDYSVSGADAQRISFELVSNLIFLQVKVNNSAPLWFVLDSGSDDSYMSPRAASALGLQARRIGASKVAGGSIQEAMVKEVSINVAGIQLQNQTILVSPFFESFEPVLGHRWDGLLGGDFIKRFVVDIDYVAKTVTLSDPRNFQYSGRGEIIPVKLFSRTPVVRASIIQGDGTSIEGKYVIDIGGTAGLVLFMPFVKKHKLIDRAQKTISVSAPNIAGQAKALVGRVRSLQLGNVEITNPIAAFSQDLAVGTLDGNIGGDILCRFHIIFDYSRERMILEPNRYFTEAYEYNMSGLRLIADTETGFFKVLQVMPNSPASEVGFREGDILTAIDGKPANDFTLDQISLMFKQDRKEHYLSIKRNEKKLQIKIKLRRLI